MSHAAPPLSWEPGQSATDYELDAQLGHGRLLVDFRARSVILPEPSVRALRAEGERIGPAAVADRLERDDVGGEALTAYRAALAQVAAGTEAVLEVAAERPALEERIAVLQATAKPNAKDLLALTQAQADLDAHARRLGDVGAALRMIHDRAGQARAAALQAIDAAATTQADAAKATLRARRDALFGLVLEQISPLLREAASIRWALELLGNDQHRPAARALIPALPALPPQALAATGDETPAAVAAP